MKTHWGAVGRDLVAAGYTFDDVGSARLPVAQFASFVVYSPPGTALFHQRNKGWTTGDHLLAQVIDALNLLVWSKTVDSQQKNPQHKPEPTPRPGMKPPKSKPVDKPMTVADYAAKAGIQMNWGEEA